MNQLRIAWVAIPLIWFAGTGPARGEITTFNNEADFLRTTKSGGPFSAPGAIATNSISVDDGRLLIKPGDGAAVVMAQKFGVKPYTVVYVGEGMVFSHLDITLGSPATTLGFLVDSITEKGFAGASEFKVTLYSAGRQTGEATFTAPGAGEVFFGVQSTEAFDLVTIREEKGGPQNAMAGGGLADREFFGKFYTDAMPGKKGKGKGAGGLVPPPLPPLPPDNKGFVPKADAAKPSAVGGFFAELDSMQITLIAVAGGAIVIAGAVAVIAVLYLLFRSRPKPEA